MRRFSIAVVSGLLFLAGAAQGAENWESFGFTIAAKDLPQLVAATDKFMASEVGKAMPGTLSLMVAEIDGADPATHSYITSTESMAAREKWNASLEGNADWQALLDAFASVATAGANARMIFLKSWAGGGDTDGVWHLFGLTVSDGGAYLKAMDTLMASETGKKFPGSLYLSSVAAAGMSTVTHVVSVGYQSEAEAEAWNDVMVQSPAWAAFQSATDSISENAGAWVLRTVKTWGTPPQ
jgi:hypothetical protein